MCFPTQKLFDVFENALYLYAFCLLGMWYMEIFVKMTHEKT